MDSPARTAQGITLVELLVVLVVIGILASLAVPAVTCHLCSGSLISPLNNARLIHMATLNMVIDGEANKDPSLDWPGDIKAKAQIVTLSDYVNILVRNDYLKPGDLKIFAGPEFKPYQGTLSSGSNAVLVPAFTEENSAFKVYLVKKDDPADTLFLATKNYTYNTPLNDPKAKPYGDKGFVILHKGGNAYILKKQQA